MWLLLALTLAPAAFGAASAGDDPAAGRLSAHTADPARTDTAPAQARAQAPLAIIVDPAAGHRPILRVGPVLSGADLEQAARAGLPVRVRVRVELWRDRFFDQLVDSASWSTVIVFEPISEQFFVRSLPAAGGVRRVATFAEARLAVESEYLLRIRPHGPGRFYYTASLHIERLSVSDLEELERWLQGEFQPAVSGQRSVPGVIGQGFKHLIVRMLDLPTRRFDARSERFDVS